LWRARAVTRAVGGRTRASNLRRVVLPAPLGPMMASASPEPRERSRPRRMRACPNERWRPRASSSGTPSCDGIDPRAELVEAEGFDDVAGVGKIENLELGLNTHVRRGNDDRKLRLSLPDAPKKIDPVGIGEAHVQDRHIRLMLLELLQCLGAS